MNKSKPMKNIFLLIFFLFGTYTWAQEFRLVNESAGIDHVYIHSSFTGGGAVFFDSNNDGFDDLYITSGQAIDQFYVNQQDGTFKEQAIDAGFGLTSTHYTTGAFAGDINNDGHIDLYVTVRGDLYTPFTKNFLYINLGDGTFVDIWPHAGIQDAVYSIGGTFIDYNQDGLLDIYVTNYVDKTGFLLSDDGEIIGYDHECFQNQLYKNKGNLSFERIDVGVTNDGCSLSAIASDLNNDDRLDLMIANDFGEDIQENTSYLNLYPEAAFANVGAQIGTDQAIYGMGIAAGDFDNDQDIDYYMTNFGANILLENNNGSFSDVAIEKGCEDEWYFSEDRTAIGWGCFFADLDNDTYQDLYIGNGFVPSPDFLNSTYGQPDKLYRNIDGQGFTEITFQAGIENMDESRGVIYSDYDNDGDLDIFVVVQNIPQIGGSWASRLYQNISPQKNYLQVNLKGNNINKSAFGSRVTLHCGEKKYLQEKLNGSSHASQNTEILHFGLDTISMIDSIIVDWPGLSINDTIYNIMSNQRITIEENIVITDTMSIDTMTMDTMMMDTMAIDTMKVDTMAMDTTILNSIEFELNRSSSILNPNPCVDKIKLSSKSGFEFNYKIISISGEIMADGVTTTNQNIEVSSIPPGIYLFQINDQNRRFTYKFLKL